MKTVSRQLEKLSLLQKLNQNSDQRGFTLVEIMVAVSLLSIMILAFATLMNNSLGQQQHLQRKFAAMDVETSVRSIFVNPQVCKCNFGGLDVTAALAAGGKIPLSSLKFYMDSSCDAATAKTMVQPGLAVMGVAGMSVDSMRLTDVKVLPGDMATADLEVAYKMEGNAMQIRGSKVAALLFKTTPAASPPQAILNCISIGGNTNITNIIGNPPEVCGEGVVCWNGKKMAFTNNFGNAVSVQIESFDSTSFQAIFRAASGRTAMLKFKEDSSGQLVGAPAKGWRGQLCYSHPAPACSTQNVFGLTQSNCDSAINWTGDYNGNSKAVATACP